MVLSVLSLFLSVVTLPGVTGSELRARAFFDANNVKRGDPLVLTVDFLGEADFAALHPPALAKTVDAREWKVYDASAKTDTFRDARRLTYRVKPLREGVLLFPAIEFSYTGPDGSKRLVRSNAIPVHAKAGRDVVVEGMEETTENGMPKPPALITEVPIADDDVRFAWRRACSKPTADAFRAFDFPEARLNEARCAIAEGAWARALKVYSRVEWVVGQTPDVEKGIVAALALQYDNPSAELPVWRQVGRPLLRYGWRGRLALVAGALAALALLFWILGRTIRAVAALALVLLIVPASASAQDIFRQMEEQMRRMQQRMHQQMNSMGGGFSMSFGNGFEEETPVEFRATVKCDVAQPQVGENFGFVISVEAPRTVSLEPMRLAPTSAFGLRVTGACENLPDRPAKNPTNVVKRIRVPVRYDAPYRGPLAFKLSIPYTRRISSNRRGFSFSSMFSREAEVTTPALALDVKPLSTVGQPAGYAGLVSEGLAVSERFAARPDGPRHAAPDRVETNDVVTVVYRLVPRNGYIPAEFLPDGAAFEWTRETDRAGAVTAVEYVRYVIADGAAATPKVAISYYDPRKKAYRTVTAGGTPLKYRPTE